ncbi:MAG: ATP-grasp domain-containing protein [bacterium]
MKVALVYNKPITGKPDSEDVLDEVELIIGALDLLGYDFETFILDSEYLNSTLSEELCLLLKQLKRYSPDVVFNLVESVGDQQRYFPVVASFFEISGYFHTGSPFDALLTTTDKILTKSVLTARGIPTPSWDQYRGNPACGPDFRIALNPPVIIKPACEDASVGIDDRSVFHDPEAILSELPEIYKRHNGQPLLIEQFIDGREFNISLLEHRDGTVEVLPVAEMVFESWPEGKPRIVNYHAKWDKSSFEYQHTVRTFNPENAPIEAIKETALKCWHVFNLRGYARVDIRLSPDGKVYVIEANANPCIASNSGFIMSAKERGYKIQDVIKEIIEVAVRKE